MKKDTLDSITDIEELINKKNDENEYLLDLINEYIQYLKEQLNHISLLLIEDNPEDIMKIVQSLKGAASRLNMHYIWQSVCLLENALKRKDLKMIDIYFEVLIKEHERLVKYLKSKEI